MSSVRKFNFKKLLKRSVFVIIGLICCAVLFCLVVLPSSLSNIVQGKGSSSLGRELTLEDLSIDWHWHTPHIHANKITLGNWDNSDNPQMVKIENLDFDIKIWKLLYGKIDLPAITIENPGIVLEKREDGSANWNLAPFSKGAVIAEGVAPDSRSSFPEIGLIKITNGTLIYRDALKNLDIKLSLDTAEGDGGKDGEKEIKITGKGMMQGQEFSLNAQGGSIDMLRGETKDFPLNLDLKMGGTNIVVKGTFDDPVQMKGVDATLKISGKTMSDLFYLTSIPLPPSPPYDISGQLGKEGATWMFNDFKGKVGGSDLSGNISFDTSGERGHMKADIYSKNMDMADLGGLIGMTPSTKEKTPSTKLLPDVPLNLERMRAADMDVVLKVDKLVAPNLPFNALQITFDLKDGLLKLDPMLLSLANGKAEGSLTLDGRGKIPAVQTNIDLKSLDIAKFFAGTRFESFTSGHFGGNIELSGNGLSLADVLGGSDGQIVMLMEGGTLSLLLVEASDLDIAEAAPLFLGEDETTDVRCAVADFDVKDGLLKSKIFVLDTTDSNVHGDVTIDLLNEAIKADLQADTKNPSPLALQSPIVISGALKKPDISIDLAETGARATAAVILGAVLTPLAAIIPYIETGLGKDSNCLSLINNAEKQVGEPIQDKPVP